MEKFQIITTYSPWFIFACLAAGALYAWVLYQKKSAWNRNLNLALAACRFLLVTLLCFLLLSPFVRQTKNTVEKPTIVFAIDNSQSVRLTSDSTQLEQVMDRLQEMQRNLQAKNIGVDVQLLDNLADTAQLSKEIFTSNATNLSELLNTIQSNYQNRNLAGVVLVSDGIYNQGVSPEFLPYNFSIFPLGMGDTIPKRDINLKAVYYNRITYLGNKFPIVAEVHSTGYSGKVANVVLKQGSKVVERKTVGLRNDADVQEVTFYSSSDKKGMQQFAVEIEPLSDEFTTQNNSRDVYIDVIDGKQKILLYALTPHPDVKAIKSILEKNDNYELEIVTVGNGSPKQTKYDLLILHQIPDNYNTGYAQISKFIEQGTPVWYILGSQSNFNSFNSVNRIINVSSRVGQIDQVAPAFNPAFSVFRFSSDNTTLLQRMPPVSVPFGDFRLPANSEVLLYQKVGNLVTNKPLLVLNTDKTNKSAVMVGEGLWEWRLEEYNLTEKHEVIDEMVSKLVQYLSAKDDKRKLRVYPIADEFYDYEKVVFESETYNDIYERIYGIPIKLVITDSEGKMYNYTFTTGESSSRFEISELPKGVYQYQATAQVQGKAEQVSGEFTVKELQLEAMNTTADHSLLRKIASQTSGQFYLPNQIDELTATLVNNPPPDRIQSSEELLEIVHLKWLFFVLLLLATIEWGVRKYQGSY